MTPRLQMLVTFAAAALQGRLAGGAFNENYTAYDQSWVDALKMMEAMPPTVRTELTISTRAFNNKGDPFPYIE